MMRRAQQGENFGTPMPFLGTVNARTNNQDGARRAGHTGGRLVQLEQSEQREEGEWEEVGGGEGLGLGRVAL